MQRIGGVIVLAVLACWFIFHSLGQMSIDPVNYENWIWHRCNESVFEQEYGTAWRGSSLFLDGNDFFIMRFNNEWNVPIDKTSCRIVEDEDDALQHFEISVFDSRIESIPSGYYRPTMDCLSTAKGASVACGIAVSVDDVINAPFTAVVAEIPTRDVEAMAAEVAKDGWKREAGMLAGTASKVVKFAKNSNTLMMSIEFVKNLGCPFEDSAEKDIFDLSNTANQYFEKAKYGQYYSNSVETLIALNEFMITLERVTVVPDSTLEGAIRFFFTLPDKINDPQCHADKQIEKLQEFQTKVSDYQEEARIKTQSFLLTLKDYKQGAKESMDNESLVRIKNAPSGWQWLLFPKAAQYHLMQPLSNTLYEKQLYISAKESADTSTEFYESYWKETQTNDYVFAAGFWIGLFFATLLILRVLGFI